MRKRERVEVGPECPRCGTTNREDRSFCRWCSVWLHPTPTRKRTKAPARSRRPPKPVSERRLSERDRRTIVVAAVHERDKVCQGGAIRALAQIEHGGPLDVHEVIPRGQWAAGYLVVSNCILLCRNHHTWVTNHAHGAHALGLRKWSWERDNG